MSKLRSKAPSGERRRVAIVGAGRSGKTSLALALQSASAEAISIPAFWAEEALPLVQAVSQDVFAQDASAYPQALEQHLAYDLTLLLGLDLAADPGALNDLPTDLARVHMDAKLRQTMDRHGIPYAVVYGLGQARTRNAMQAIAHHASNLDFGVGGDGQAKVSGWQWCCDTGSDATCERHLFRALVKTASVRD